MIILILSCLLLALLVACFGIAVRESRAQKRRASAQRVWSDRQLFQAEMKLHQLASDTFGSMMKEARQDDNGSWQR